MNVAGNLAVGFFLVLVAGLVLLVVVRLGLGWLERPRELARARNHRAAIDARYRRDRGGPP